MQKKLLPSLAAAVIGAGLLVGASFAGSAGSAGPAKAGSAGGEARRNAARQPLHDRLRVPRSRALLRGAGLGRPLHDEPDAAQLSGQAGPGRLAAWGRMQPASPASRATGGPTRSRSSAACASATARRSRRRRSSGRSNGPRTSSRPRRRSPSCTTSSAQTRAPRARRARSLASSRTVRRSRSGSPGRTRPSWPRLRCRSSRR